MKITTCSTATERTTNGSDVLTGNGGADTFVFSGSHITITDFSHSDGDLIDLSFLNFSAGITETELQAIISASPDAHTLDFGNGQVLTVTNVNVSTLQSSDFIARRFFCYARILRPCTCEGSQIRVG